VSGPRREAAWQWLDDRLGLSGLRYPVPRYANSLPYVLGAVTATSFVLLVITGIYLGQFYDPGTSEGAYNSVVYIIETPALGELIRSLHFWLAAILVVTLVLHMVRTFFTASFKAPREVTWILGVLLFGLGGGALYTGTLLKVDQEAVEALAHSNEIADFFGVLGFWFSADFTDNVSQLVRTYIAHVSIVPVLILGLLIVHMLLIKRHGISPVPRGSAAEIEARESTESEVPFSSHLNHIGIWSLIVLGAALVLAGLFPTALGPFGVEGIEVTKPPWYFLWLYTPENWFGLDAIWIGSGALILGLLAIPFLDRSPERDPRRRWPWVGLGVAVIIAWVALTISGWLSEVVSHVG
jgi:ubiquinol-cytochrome c reductase cytochrome b subunit